MCELFYILYQPLPTHLECLYGFFVINNPGWSFKPPLRACVNILSPYYAFVTGKSLVRECYLVNCAIFCCLHFLVGTAYRGGLISFQTRLLTSFNPHKLDCIWFKCLNSHVSSRNPYLAILFRSDFNWSHKYISTHVIVLQLPFDDDHIPTLFRKIKCKSDRLHICQLPCRRTTRTYPICHSWTTLSVYKWKVQSLVCQTAMALLVILLYKSLLSAVVETVHLVMLILSDNP